MRAGAEESCLASLGAVKLRHLRPQSPDYLADFAASQAHIDELAQN